MLLTTYETTASGASRHLETGSVCITENFFVATKHYQRDPDGEDTEKQMSWLLAGILPVIVRVCSSCTTLIIKPQEQKNPLFCEVWHPAEMWKPRKSKSGINSWVLLRILKCKLQENKNKQQREITNFIYK